MLYKKIRPATQLCCGANLRQALKTTLARKCILISIHYLKAGLSLILRIKLQQRRSSRHAQAQPAHSHSQPCVWSVPPSNMCCQGLGGKALSSLIALSVARHLPSFALANAPAKRQGWPVHAPPLKPHKPRLAFADPRLTMAASSQLAAFVQCPFHAASEQRELRCARELCSGAWHSSPGPSSGSSQTRAGSAAHK